MVNDKNFGNVTISLIDGTSLKVYFNKDIADKLEREDQDTWYDFLKDIRRFSKKNMLAFDTRDINRNSLDIRDIMQQTKSSSQWDGDEIKIQESKMYGTRTKSYDTVGETRLIVRHSSLVDDEKRGARTRNIESIFVETADGERFKLPFTSLHGARAIGQHVASGGTIVDDRSSEIFAMVEEVQQLGKFLRATRNGQAFEDTEVPAMVDAARDRFFEVRKGLKAMRGPKGYARFWENYVSSDAVEIGEDGDALRERFTKKFLDQRIEEALPYVYAAHEARQSRLDSRSNLALAFEQWVEEVLASDELTEGTWALPSDENAVRKFNEIMAKPLEFGPDGDNAASALYDIFGDDELFDELYAESQNQAPASDARPTIVKWFTGFYKNLVRDNFDGASRKHIDAIANGLRNWKPQQDAVTSTDESSSAENLAKSEVIAALKSAPATSPGVPTGKDVSEELDEDSDVLDFSAIKRLAGI